MTGDGSDVPRLDAILERARLVVSVGTGGVGKTTTAAACALRGAARGKKVLVLTIDPAKRLADAMGLTGLTNEPRPVDLSGLAAAKGTLDAMMLEPRITFDNLIRKTAGDRAEAILGNRVYRMMADHFAGIQEYMALERLFDLYESGRWELIVLDTPPSKNAFDFFTAPKRVSKMFDERIMKWFLPEMNRDVGFFRRVFNPGAVVLRMLALLGGDDFIAELSEFFAALNLIRDSLQKRGDRITIVMREPTTQYIVVAGPDPCLVDEAILFHDRLRDMGKSVGLFVLNRCHEQHRSEDLDVVERVASDTLASGASGESATEIRSVVRRLHTWYPSLVALAERDRAGAAALIRKVGVGMVRLVPNHGHDIHTLAELLGLSEEIAGTA